MDESPNRAIWAFEPFLENISGPQLSPADLEGQVVIANFITHPCSRCQREAELFRQLASSFRSDTGITFLQLDCTIGSSMKGASRSSLASGLPIYRGAAAAKNLGIGNFPSVMVIDRTGREFSLMQGKDLTFETILNAVLSAKIVTGKQPPGSSEIENRFVAPPCAPIFLFLLSLASMAGGVLITRRIRRRRRTELIYELDAVKQESFSRIQSGFQALSKATRVWEIVSKTSTYDWKRNAGCGALVSRKAIRCGVTAIPNVFANVDVFGIDSQSLRVFALPDALLCWRNGRFAAVSYMDLTVAYSHSRFTEDESLPSDARMIGTTWRYVNKDGSPDRRFNNNRQLPVALYGEIKVQFSANLELNLQVSSLSAAYEFVEWFKAPCRGDNSQTSADYSQRIDPPQQPASEKAWAAKTLGVNDNASREDIALAYRHLAQKYHPDKVASLAPEFQQLADQKMKDINRAFSILK